MRIFAIGDLHLSTQEHKPMDVFGTVWTGHQKLLTENWRKYIDKEDLVLIAGDISWAMRLQGAREDLDILERLPGQKICIRGNHDYWWDRPGKLNGLYQSLFFLQNKAYKIGRLAICGTRGWMCPGDLNFAENDEKILNREVIRLRLSLEDAARQNANEMIVMLHYPPTYQNLHESPFKELFKTYPVTHVIYGHLHDEDSWKKAPKGIYQNINYHLVSADYLKFVPHLIKV